MNSNKVHSKRTVLPYSWESKSVVTKNKDHDFDHHTGGGGRGGHGGDGGDVLPLIKKLPPPPCPKDGKQYPNPDSSIFQHDLKIPPPPCANFQPLQQQLRSNSLRRSFRRYDDDPFLIAYIECTKSSTSGRDDHHKWSGSGVFSTNKGDHQRGFGVKKNLSLLSCKHSGNLINNSIVRVSRFPTSKSQKDS